MQEISTTTGFIAELVGRRINNVSTTAPKYLVIRELDSPDAMNNLTPMAQRNIGGDEKRIQSRIKNGKDAVSVRIWPE